MQVVGRTPLLVSCWSVGLLVYVLVQAHIGTTPRGYRHITSVLPDFPVQVDSLARRCPDLALRGCVLRRVCCGGCASAAVLAHDSWLSLRLWL